MNYYKPLIQLHIGWSRFVLSPFLLWISAAVKTITALVKTLRHEYDRVTSARARMRVTLTTVRFFNRAAALVVTVKLRSQRSFWCSYVPIFLLHLVSFYHRQSHLTNQHEIKSNKTKSNDLRLSFILFLPMS